MLKIGHYLEKSLGFCIKCSIPQTTSITLIAAGFGWYGRRVALTYAPGYLIEYCVKSTIESMGNETVGRIAGTTIVAPVLVPSLTSKVALGVSFAFWYVAVLVSNLFYYIINWKSSKKEEKPPS